MIVLSISFLGLSQQMTVLGGIKGQKCIFPQLSGAEICSDMAPWPFVSHHVKKSTPTLLGRPCHQRLQERILPCLFQLLLVFGYGCMTLIFAIIFILMMSSPDLLAPEAQAYFEITV